MRHRDGRPQYLTTHATVWFGGSVPALACSQDPTKDLSRPRNIPLPKPAGALKCQPPSSSQPWVFRRLTPQLNLPAGAAQVHRHLRHLHGVPCARQHHKGEGAPGVRYQGLVRHDQPQHQYCCWRRASCSRCRGPDLSCSTLFPVSFHSQSPLVIIAGL